GDGALSLPQSRGDPRGDRGNNDLSNETDLTCDRLVTMKRPAPGDRQSLLAGVVGHRNLEGAVTPANRSHNGGRGATVMSNVTGAAGPIHLGMDTSKNTIVVGILMPGDEVPVIDRIWNEEGSVRHLVGRLGDPAALRACYEAGPCGLELHRLLASMGVACDVVAPSLIPRRAGDRVKTDKRDASRLARLHRAGELTPIRVPSPAEEAVRDLVRVRAALLADRKRAQQRLT